MEPRIWNKSSIWIMEYFCCWPISCPYARFYCNTFISAIGPFEWGNRVRSSYILTLTLFVYKICETPQDDFGPCHHKEVLNPRPGAKAEVVKMRPTSPCTKTGWSHGINFQLVGIIPLFFSWIVKYRPFMNIPYSQDKYHIIFRTSNTLSSAS